MASWRSHRAPFFDYPGVTPTNSTIVQSFQDDVGLLLSRSGNSGLPVIWTVFLSRNGIEITPKYCMEVDF